MFPRQVERQLAQAPAQGTAPAQAQSQPTPAAAAAPAPAATSAPAAADEDDVAGEDDGPRPRPIAVGHVGADPEPSAARHGIEGVRHDFQDGLLDLHRIHPHRRQGRGHGHLEVDVLFANRRRNGREQIVN